MGLLLARDGAVSAPGEVIAAATEEEEREHEDDDPSCG
jgi:hypothetical protein